MPEVSAIERLRARLPRPERIVPRLRRGGDRRPAPADQPPARPAWLPTVRWGRLALLFLLAFTLFRGFLVGVTIPAFWAPDEDYHFLYAEYITTQHALIDPDKPLYPYEYAAAASAIDYDSYCCGPRDEFTGDPRASIKQLSKLPDSAREPEAVGRGIGVVHPPLYHLAAAVVNWAAGDSSILTRLTWVRFLTAVFGVVAVYGAWLLAAQVFRDIRLQLLSGFIMAVQPMVAYLAGIANHDSALIAFSTLALAMMVFILRKPPCMKQGAWLGTFLVLALLVKGSAFALVPVGALAYLGQGLAFRHRWREVLRSAGLALGLVLVLAVWWYVRARIVYGEATGATSAITTGGGPGASLADIWQWIREWTGLTYRTYWWHYIFFQAPGPSPSKYIPAFIGGVGMLGLVRLAWVERRRLLLPDSPLLRQVVLLTVAALAFYIPFMVVDLIRRADGLAFYVNGGRYLLPAYAGVAVLLLAGVRELVRREAQGLVFTVLGLVAFAFGTFVYLKFSLWHYFDREPLGELLRRMTFNRPAFVTEGTLGVLLGLIVATLLGFAYAVFRSGRPPRPRAAESEARTSASEVPAMARGS